MFLLALKGTHNIVGSYQLPAHLPCIDLPAAGSLNSNAAVFRHDS